MKTTLIIKGTHCNACKILIEDVSSEMKGITSCTVDYVTGNTVIEHDEDFDWGSFKEGIEGLGKYAVDLPPRG